MIIEWNASDIIIKIPRRITAKDYIKLLFTNRHFNCPKKIGKITFVILSHVEDITN